jgi:hypothetical protein
MSRNVDNWKFLFRLFNCDDFCSRYISKIPVMWKRPSIYFSCIIVTSGEALLISVPYGAFEFLMLICCHKYLYHHVWVSFSWTNYKLQYTIWHITLPLYWLTQMKVGGTEADIYTNVICFMLEVTEYFIHQFSEADWLTRSCVGR